MSESVNDVAPRASDAIAVPGLADVTTVSGGALGDEHPMDAARPDHSLGLSLFATLTLAAGALALTVPTMLSVARESWSTEQGAHGPIVLLTGIWLFFRAWKQVGPIVPPPAWRPLVLLMPLLALFAVARVSQIVEIEGYLMYAVLLAGFYALVGGRVMRKLIFPLIYLAFLFPPPDTVVYALTLPMKIGITQAAVSLLALIGYPIGYSGVSIQIGQYQLLVAAACSGLNSIISLSVLATFYIYVRHTRDRLRTAVMFVFIVPVALAANFVRVLILILLTYHAGEAAAQSFLHDFAGLTMFVAALLFLFALDLLADRIADFSRRRGARTAAVGHAS
jgi:exosortase